MLFTFIASFVTDMCKDETLSDLRQVQATRNIKGIERLNEFHYTNENFTCLRAAELAVY